MFTRHTLISLSAATALIALAGCGERTPSPAPQPSGDTTAEATKTTPAPALPAAAPVANVAPRQTDAPALTERDCLLVVDGVTHVSGRCLVYPMGDGGFTLNVWSRGKPARSHFAVVSVNGQDAADASWNKDPDDSHAWDPLGAVALEDGCWVNARARICARQTEFPNGKGVPKSGR